VKRVLPLAASLVAHVAVLATGRSWLVERVGHAPGADDVEVGVVDAQSSDVPSDVAPTAAAASIARAAHTPETRLPRPGAGARAPRVDDAERGRGGEAKSPRATNLSDQIEALDLARQVPSHLDADQLQRVRSASVRTTRDDRRATLDPMELLFVATGDGNAPHRRDREGAMAHGVFAGRVSPSVVGASSTRASSESGEDGAPRPAAGTGAAVLPRGVDEGMTVASEKIASMRARPMVDRAIPTVPAEVHSRRTADTVDSLDLARAKTRSLVHASVAGATEDAPGAGGERSDESTPASGGNVGTRSKTTPLGSGGATADWNTRDPRMLSYVHAIHKKLDPLWRDAFPKERTLALEQGTVILEFDVEENGVATLVWPPKRPSGVPEFDANCASAVRRASPFPPIPRELRDAGIRRIRVIAPFSSNNGIVQ